MYGVSETPDKYEGGGHDHFSGRVNPLVKCHLLCHRHCNHTYKSKPQGNIYWMYWHIHRQCTFTEIKNTGFMATCMYKKRSDVTISYWFVYLHQWYSMLVKFNSYCYGSYNYLIFYCYTIYIIPGNRFLPYICVPLMVGCHCIHVMLFSLLNCRSVKDWYSCI